VAKSANANAAEPGLAARLPALLLCAAALASILSYSVLRTAPFSLPKLVYGSWFAFAAVLTALAAGWKGPRAARPAPLDAPAASLLGAVMLAAVFSTDRPLSLLGQYEYYGYGVIACVLYAALYWRAARTAAHERGWLSAALAVAAAVAGVCSVAQAMGFELFLGIRSAEAFGARKISVFGNPVYAGAVFAVLLPPVAGRALRAGAARPAFIAAGLLGIAGLFLTRSSGAWLAAATGVAAYLLGSGRLDRRVSRRFAFRGILGLAAAVSAGAMLFAYASGRQSDRGRTELWKLSGRVFADRPVLGVGPGAFENAFRKIRSDEFIATLGAGAGQANAHNDILQALATTGLVGFAAYAWLLSAAAFALRRSLDEEAVRDEAAAYAGGLIALFVQAKVNPTPLPSLAAGTVLLGLLSSVSQKPDEVGSGIFPRAAGAALAALCLAACGLAWRLDRADRLAMRARIFRSVGETERALEHFRRTLGINPYETQYRMDAITTLMREAKRAPAVGVRRGYLDEAVAIARESARLRPEHPDSHQMLALALLRRGDAGSPELFADAVGSIETAMALAPRFPNILKIRAALAEKTGDRDARARVVSELKAIEELVAR
jgi:O-antigen ligase